MMEKRGVIDRSNTRPESKGEKDLEKHFTKRAADKVSKSARDEKKSEGKK